MITVDITAELVEHSLRTGAVLQPLIQVVAGLPSDARLYQASFDGVRRVLVLSFTESVDRQLPIVVSQIREPVRP